MLAHAAPAGAHGGAILTIHGDGHGSVWVVAQYQDGHPITGPVGAVLTATSAATGQRVGPVALRQQGDGTLVYSGTLTAGEWSVVAEMATPVLGRCATTLRVAGPGASGAPEQVRCTALVGPVAETPARDEPSPGSAWPWLAVGLSILAAVGALALFATRKSRPPVSGLKRRR